MTKDNHTPSVKTATNDAAINLARARIDTLFSEGSTANTTDYSDSQSIKPLSKHQQFMKQLSNSGESLAEIQTKWHNYYLSLSDEEKRTVWQEFYATNKQQIKPSKQPVVSHQLSKENVFHNNTANTKQTKQSKQKENLSQLKKRLTQKAANQAKAKLTAKQHFQSLLFGIGAGLTVLLILLFGFFNERFIAPFITPSKKISSTPIIIDSKSNIATNESKIIIPKINVEVPVVYDTNSIQEKDIQKALERGVVHYSTTPNPGEHGNAVIVGHSSNNIFNNGKYKFAFVLLNRLDNDDTFSLTKNGKQYFYKIYEKKIVNPTDVSVLKTADKPDTVTLITCDPPGTSINRLIIIGEQISPKPSANIANSKQPSNNQPAIVPGNAPSLWSRFTNWLTG